MKNLLMIMTVCFLMAFTADNVLTVDEASKIIHKINNEMRENKSYSTNIKYSIYKTHQDTFPSEIMLGFYKKGGKNEHSLIVGVETIQNEKMRLIVDTNSQTLILTEPRINEGLIEESLQAALNSCSKIKKTEYVDKVELTLDIKPDSYLGFSKIIVQIDKQRYVISRMELYYTNSIIPGFEAYKAPKLIVDYSDYNFKKSEKAEFSFQKYVSEQNGKYVPTDNYKNYSFTNIIGQ